MPREKYKTLTEQMYYVLLALQREQCGVDIMESVRQMTDGRIRLGPGTLYTLLGDFQNAGLIEEIKEAEAAEKAGGEAGGGKRIYRIATPGRDLLNREHRRHLLLIEDFRRFYRGEGNEEE